MIQICLLKISGPKQALVYRFHEVGGPEKLKLAQETVPAPPARHVRVAIKALSLNNADRLFLLDQYVDTPKLPSRLGYDVCGIVDAVGENVTSFKVGDRVNALPACPVAEYGAFAELSILPEHALMKTPSNLNDIEGASFGVAYFTNYYGLFELASLKPFHTLLLTAATSTTGLAAIGVAKAVGARVIATTRSRKKAKILTDAGADEVIATGEEDIVQRVNAITHGKGVDVCYDCIAGTMAEKIVQCIRPKGQWVVYGLMDTSPAPFPWLIALGKAVEIYPYPVFSFTGHETLGFPLNMDMIRRGVEHCQAGFESGKLSITFGKVFDGLEKLPEAIQVLSDGHETGKIAIKL